MPFVPDQQTQGRFVPDQPVQHGATGSWNRGATGSWESPQLASMGQLDRFRTGAKVAGTEQLMGLRQAFGGNVTPEQVDAYRQQNSELMQDPMGRAGATSANVAMATIPAMIPGAQTIAGSMLSGGAYGFAQPVGKNESRVDNTLLGAGTQGAVTAGMKFVGRAFQPVKNANNVDEQAAVDLLRKNGVQLSVAAQTGSKPAMGAQRMLSNNPYTAPAMSEKGAQSARTLTRAFLRTAGIEADKATPEVLGAADSRIGNVIGSINAKYRLNISDPAIASKLTEISDEAASLPNGNFIVAQIQKLKDAAPNGMLDAKAAQKFRTVLGKLSRDQVVGEYAYQTREVLDEALQNATRGTGDFSRLAAARSEYRNLQAIADSADTTANGQISGPRLASALSHSKYTKNSFRYGSGDTKLSELARAASTVADRFPNSGTAYHVGAQLAIPTAVGGISYATDKDPEKALKLAAMTYGLPKAAAFAMNNPAVANYLARGIPVSPVANQLAGYVSRIAPPVATGLVVGQ